MLVKKHTILVVFFLIFLQIVQGPVTAYCLAPKSQTQAIFASLTKGKFFQSDADLQNAQIQDFQELTNLTDSFSNNLAIDPPALTAENAESFRDDLSALLSKYNNKSVQIICKYSSKDSYRQTEILLSVASQLGFKTLLIIPNSTQDKKSYVGLPKADYVYFDAKDEVFADVVKNLISLDESVLEKDNKKITTAPKASFINKFKLLGRKKDVAADKKKKSFWKGFLRRSLLLGAVMVVSVFLFVADTVVKYEYVDTTPVDKYYSAFVESDSVLVSDRTLDSICIHYLNSNLNNEPDSSLQAALNIKTYEAEETLAQNGYFSDIDGLSDLKSIETLVMQNDPKAFMTLVSVLGAEEGYSVDVKREALKIATKYINVLNSDIGASRGNLAVAADLISTSLESSFMEFYQDSRYTEFIQESCTFLSSVIYMRLVSPSGNFINTLIAAVSQSEAFENESSRLYVFNLLELQAASLGNAAVNQFYEDIFSTEQVSSLNDRNIMLALEIANRKWGGRLQDMQGDQNTVCYDFINNEEVLAKAKDMARNVSGSYTFAQQKIAMNFMVALFGKSALISQYAIDDADFSAYSTGEKIFLLNIVLNADTDDYLFALEEEALSFMTDVTASLDVVNDKEVLSYLNEIYADNLELVPFWSSKGHKSILGELLNKISQNYTTITAETILDNKTVVDLYITYAQLFKEVPTEAAAYLSEFTHNPEAYNDALFDNLKAIDDFIYISTFASTVYNPAADSSVTGHDLQNKIIDQLKKYLGDDIGGSITIPQYAQLMHNFNRTKGDSGNELLISLNADYINNALSLDVMSPEDIVPAVERAVDFDNVQTMDKDIQDAHKMIANYIFGRVAAYINNNPDIVKDDISSSELRRIKGVMEYYGFAIDETPNDIIKTWQNIKQGNWSYLGQKVKEKFRGIFSSGSELDIDEAVVADKAKEKDADQEEVDETSEAAIQFAIADSNTYKLDSGYRLIEVRKKNTYRILSYVIKGDTAQGARVKLMFDVGNLKGGVDRSSLHISNQRDSSVILDAPLGFSKSQRLGSSLGFSADNGVVTNAICLPNRNEAIVLINPDGKMHIADKKDLWLHDLDSSLTGDKDRKLDVANDLTDYMEFVRLIQEQKLTCVTTLLLSSPSREIAALNDGEKSRRLIAADADGNIVVVDTEVDMTTGDATEIMKAIVGEHVAIAYMDTGGVDYAQMAVNDNSQILETGTSGNKSSVNRLFLLKTPASQGQLKDIGGYDPKADVMQEQLEFVRENIWRPSAENITALPIQVKNAVNYSMKVILDDVSMPEGMSAYHFYDGNDLVVVVKDRYYDEALYHEMRESYWITHYGLSVKEAHRLAAAEQAIEFPNSVYYQDQIDNKSYAELYLLFKEDASARAQYHALVKKYLGEEKMVRVMQFEESFRQRVQEAMEHDKWQNEKLSFIAA